MKTTWSFYGRARERADILRLIHRGHWFFCSITGRRRIGKTTLIRNAVKEAGVRAFYVQMPDSDAFGVVNAMRDAVEDHEMTDIVNPEKIRSLADVAQAVGAICRSGCIVVIDEFQYFHRKALYEFTSYLQNDVDRLREIDVGGGLFVLGSIHTEMTAILEDQSSPLFNRLTDRLQLGHWDFATLVEMFRAHGIEDPRAWLFFWTLFEGVPKFYHDAWQQDALTGDDGHRRVALTRLFLEGLSPLRDEAENWFLRELRGRYDSVLKVVAARQPCSHAELRDAFKAEAGDEKQLGGYLKILIERYSMIEMRKPIFSADRQRNARYVITDNFLSAWLVALGRAADLARIQPVERAVVRADERLTNLEGFAFEKMIREVLRQASANGKGPISLTMMVEGWWDKPDSGLSNIEIDVIGVDTDAERILFGSCKRSADKHTGASLAKSRAHIESFLSTKLGANYRRYEQIHYAFAPVIGVDRRHEITTHGFVPMDLLEFAQAVMTRKNL
ncbi:hypothetical protein JL101_027335 [Skermanella rosea]|uniref:ATP-binding protein n=1 Tax=Skermanella rosea TaxID=1817965 RepID=UPI001933D5E7|nr:ATP-binding protein [Skermanella rosea]UEM03622.1 hypothetical protein JL101_027335 [Skermanella rosea]